MNNLIVLFARVPQILQNYRVDAWSCAGALHPLHHQELSLDG